MNAVTGYGRQLGSFSRNARLYLLSTVIQGLSYSVFGLFFNLFVVSQGYSRTFLGTLQSLPNLIALVGTLPAGMVVDVIGRRRSLLAAGLGRTAAYLGIVLAPGPGWLLASMVLAGVANALAMVSSAPFLMENSTVEERNALFSANFGLQTLIGFVGTLVGGYLPSLFGGALGVDVEGPLAYGATLGVTVVLLALSLWPIFLITEPPRRREPMRSMLPWRNISDLGLVTRLFIPNLIISMGAAILIPYMNLFFKETFGIPDRVLGTIFAVSAVVTGVATLASPLLADRWGRIRALVYTQLSSIPFLLAIGFVPVLGVAAVAMWIRAALMNMGNPLYNAFAMEQVHERERATVSGLMGMSWTLGWTIGPFISGAMQANPEIGFQPIFVITCSFYLVAALLEKRFFQRRDDRQRRAALLEGLGVADGNGS